MRILKGDEHILMPSPVAVHGKRFWSLGILNYFSFDDPDTLLFQKIKIPFIKQHERRIAQR